MAISEQELEAKGWQWWDAPFKDSPAGRDAAALAGLLKTIHAAAAVQWVKTHPGTQLSYTPLRKAARLSNNNQIASYFQGLVVPPWSFLAGAARQLELHLSAEPLQLLPPAHLVEERLELLQSLLFRTDKLVEQVAALGAAAEAVEAAHRLVSKMARPGPRQPGR